MKKVNDLNRELKLDAKAVAGLMYEIFGVEMTSSPTECATAARKVNG
jgi:hypothetical protein